MNVLKKILFVLFSIVLGAVFATSVANQFVTYESGWDGIAGTLGWLFFGGVASLILSVISLRHLSLKQFNKAFFISLIGFAILLVWFLIHLYRNE